MSAPQIPPPAPTAAASPTGAAGLVSLPSEIIRLPQELAARLLSGLRTVFVSGTVTGQRTDGTLNVRSQFGEIIVRAGTAVPADRQVSLQIPPLSGKAATLTPPQLSRNPIPATLLLSKPAAPQSAAGDTSAPNVAPPAGSRIAPLPGSPAPTVLSAPSPASTPVAGPPLTAAPPAANSTPVLQQQGGPAGQPAQTAANPAAPGNVPTPQPGGPTAPHLPNHLATTPRDAAQAAPRAAPQAAPRAAVATAGSPPAQSQTSGSSSTVSGDRPAQGTPPLGRLALTAQLLTQSGGQPVTASPTPPATQSVAQPPGVTPQTQGPAPPAAPSSVPGAASSPPVGQPAAATTSGASAAMAGARPPPPPLAGEIGRDAVPIDSARRVPALREAISVLSAVDPTLATQFVRSVLPQANSQLAATLLFFLSATRSGDIRGWIGGRVASTLDGSGRGDLLPKLSAELAAPGRTMPEPAAGEWRSQTIPLYQDGDIGGMAVHMRRPEDNGSGAGEGEAAGHRFLIDMDLSRMGPLQLDGLVHDRRFDLTIRSPAAFSEPMRQDMRTLFHDASNAVGLHGGLTFQVGGHDWATVATAHGR